MTKSDRSTRLLVIGIFWLVLALSWAAVGNGWITFACIALGLGFIAYSVSQLNKERKQQHDRTHT